jgi:DNA polymerase-1
MLTVGGGEQGEPTVRRLPLRLPHVLTDLREVHTAVEKLLGGDLFCFDVETIETPEARALETPNPRTNRISWIGLGAAAQVYVIPLEIQHGITLSPAHKEKRPAFEVYGPDDERSYTPTTKHLPPGQRKISQRMVEVPVPAVYASPPRTIPIAEVMAALHPLMFSDLGKLGHNVKFDLQTIAKYYGGQIPPGPYHDTIILRHILKEDERNYRLKPLVWDWLRLKPDRYPELAKATEVHLAGMDEAARYLAKDVRYPWLMFRDFFPRLKRKGLAEVYEFEMSLYPVLMEMEQAGFPVERNNMDKVRRDLEERIHEIEASVWKAAGGQFPMSNTNARRWVMFGEGKPSYPTDPKTGQLLSRQALKTQGAKVLFRTEKTDTPMLTQAILGLYADRGNKMASDLLDWSLHDKLRGTFIEGLGAMLVPHPDSLPTLHTSFNQHGTATGRLSSSRPNLQNLPRGTLIRDLFVADEEWLLISADYDQIELRVLAHEANERNMIKVFQDRRDIHKEAAAAGMRIDPAAVTPEQRQVGKTLNFATSYGAGPGRIAAVAGVSQREGQAFLERYYAQFPAIQPWKSRVLRAARERGDRADVAKPPAVVIPPFGRLRRLPDLYDVHDDGLRKRAERQAVNAVIQGFASYITKLAMLALRTNLEPFPAHMVLQVHDEIVVRVRKPWVEEVRPIVTSTMMGIRGTDGQPILGDIPLVVSAETGYTWADAKGK